MSNKQHNKRYQLRDEKGRFVSKIFKEQIIHALAGQKGISTTTGEGKAERNKKIKDIREEAKISDRELFVFYEQNKDVFIDMLHEGALTDLSRNSNQLSNDLSKYRGEIILNGKEVSNAEAKLALAEFKQILSSEINVVDFTIKPEIHFDGKMVINIPDSKHIIDELIEYFGLDDISELDEFTGEEITNALKEILDAEYGEDNVIIYAS